MKIYAENGIENVLHNMPKYGITTQDMWNFSFATQISGSIGILIAFTISIIISIHKKWSIINSFIVLILSFLLNRFGLLNWPFSQIPGNFIDDIFLKLLIKGTFFLIIGFLIFFLKRTNGIIDKHHAKLHSC